MPAPATKTMNQLWQIDCVPTCGASFRDHNSNALVEEAKTHARIVHPEMKMGDADVKKMMKKV